MKKALFLILLLPFIGLSQNASYNASELLVRWEGTRINWSDPSTSPMYYYGNTNGTINTPTDFSAANISGNGINFNSAEIYSGYYSSGWPSNASSSTPMNDNNYYELKLTAATGKQILLKNFRFKYSNNANAYKIIYLKSTTNAPNNNNFVSTGTVLTTNTSAGLLANQDLTYAFPSGFYVLPNETLYVRIYAYQVDKDNNKWFLLHNGAANYDTNNGGAGNSGSTGPAFYGVVSAASTPNATAGNDTFSVIKNTATELSVFSNDNAGSSGFASMAVQSQPSHGTATVTNSNKITYTPTNNYTGADSFTYKITSGNGNTATATVSISVLAVSPNSPLTGTITIGSNGDFSTITAAVNHLNTYGISGNVTFRLINTAAYNEASGETFPITINHFTNANGNTVTFKPATGINAIIEAPRTTNGNWWGTPAVFKINGGDNIIFDGSNATGGTTRNLIIANSSYVGDIIHTDTSNDYADRAVIWLAANGSSTNDAVNNVTIKNIVIKQSYKNSADNFCMGIFAGSNAIMGGNNEISHDSASGKINNITIDNNDFVNVKQGVYFNGNNSLISQTLTIKGNDLGSENNTESVILPVLINNVNGFDVVRNYIYKLYRTTTAADFTCGGINITGVSRNGNIYKNDIKDLKRLTEDGQIFAGIVLASTYPSNNIMVYNNFILDVSAKGNGGGYSNGYGIVVDQGSGYKIYHNSVVLTPVSNQTNGGYSAALYVNENVSALDVRNNIFANLQTQTTTRRTAISVKNTSSNINTVFSYLDYNNYYTTDRIGYIATSNTQNITWPGNGIQGSNEDNADYRYTLAQWQAAVNSTATGKEAHSKNVNPVFMSATDLHISASSANNGFADAGTPAIYSLVGKDIDGQVRKSTAPDMGADEFGTVTAPTAGTPGNNPGIYCDSSTTFTGYVNGVEQWTNGAPTIEKDVIFNANFTQDAGQLNACSIYVLAGKAVLFTGNATAMVQHSVNVDNTNNGSLTFESGSNLIQVDDDQNTGVAVIKRKAGMLKRLDYTLWCAPVTDYREGTSTVNGVTTTEYQSFTDFSPETSTTPSRFYYYNTLNDQFLEHNPVLDRFVKGKCALIRMPNSLPNVPGYNAGTARTQFEGKFEGTPNTGTIRLPLTYTTVNGEVKDFNGTGNPYPSPINIMAFLQENTINNGSITGTLWIWRKTNNYYISSYAYCNMAGYVANEGGNNDGNTILPISGAAVPTLNTGQGFIVRATGANRELVFKNDMREDSHSTVFFKTMNGPAAIANGKVWLNVTGGENFSQVLVAYNDITTLGYDNGYDGEVFAAPGFTLYSIIPQQEADAQLAIQTRGSFTQADAVPMGYIAPVAGTFEFSIDHVEGVFAEGQDVYIKDNELGTSHKLNDGNYVFTTEAGTFNDRFEVTYVAQGELDTDVPVVNANEVIIYKDNQQVKVTSPEDINSITVYDMLGRTLFTQNKIDGTEFSTPQLEVAQQVVIVSITLDNNQVVSKKIMM